MLASHFLTDRRTGDGEDVKDDVEIAHSVRPRSIAEIAGRLGLADRDLYPVGHDVAKVDLAALERPRERAVPAGIV